MNDHWFERLNYVVVENPSYLIVGSAYLEPNKYGHGVIAAANDEFTAFRLAKEINKDSQSKVMVLPNSVEIIAAIETALLETAFESVENRKGKPQKSTAAPLRDS